MHTTSNLVGCDDDDITYTLIMITTTKLNKMTIRNDYADNTTDSGAPFFAKENTVAQS